MGEVTIKLFASLQQYLPPGSVRRQTRVALQGETRVGDILAEWGVPRASTHLILVNGLSRSWETVIRDGDVVSVFPNVAGG